MPWYADDTVTLHHGDTLDVLRTMPDESVHCVVTSPPYYGLRDYDGQPGQYGLEATPAAYVERMRAVFAEVRRVLRADGTLWLNLGDSYAAAEGQGNRGPSVALEGGGRPSFRRDSANVAAPRRTAVGLPPKNLLGMPWRVAFALQDDGWTLRNEVVWHKPNSMPESVTDRLSTRHEKLFLFSRSRRYEFDLDAIREPQQSLGERHEGRSGYRDEHPSKGRINTRTLNPLGGNPGDLWSIPTSPYPGAHFAVFPPELPRRCILAGCPEGGTVLDPFSGAATTGLVAEQTGRRYIGIDLSENYLRESLDRLRNRAIPFGEAS